MSMNLNNPPENNEGADPSNHLANQGQVITIEDARGFEKILSFKAFLTTYEDRFESNWNETEVYARMDPIYTFQNTKRTINIGFDVPSYGAAEASSNIKKSMTLSRLLYPTYTVNEGVATLSAATVFKVQFANLIADVNTGGGLYGIIKSYAFKPKLEAGFFTQNNQLGASKSIIVPKVLEVSFDFNVLHAHPLGYEQSTGEFRSDDPKAFPHGLLELEKQSYEIAYAQSIGDDPAEGPAAIQEAQSSSMLDSGPIAGSGWGDR